MKCRVPACKRHDLVRDSVYCDFHLRAILARAMGGSR